MSRFLCSCFCIPPPKIPDEYLRPQGLYSLERVDLKKLKRLIQNQQLAPCHPGAEEPVPGEDLEECPICFLHYPVLNSSLCCQKRVCTECFLQVQTSTPPHQLSACPFCKVTRATGYLVKLIGARTAEDKEEERVEEQKVIEARIREREEEVRRDEERVLQRQQQQQQQQAASAAAAGNRTSAANASGGNTTQQQPSAGVMAAAAAAASSLEPLGATAGSAAGGRAAGHGATATSAAAITFTDPPTVANSGGGGGHGSHYTGRHQSGDRHRAATTAAAAATGAPTTTVVQVGGGTGAGIYPTTSARRAAAAAAAAMSAAIEQQQHHHHHPGDRYVIAPDAGAGGGAQPEAPDNGAAAHGGGGGGPQRRHQGAGRRYRLTDYVPAGVVDIAMGLDDINDLMLEQAMYESLADAVVAGPPQTQPAAAAAGVGGGEGAVSDPNSDDALTAALAASLNGGGAESLVADRAALPQPPQPRAAALVATAAVGGPAGRSGWRQASARSGGFGSPGTAFPSPPARGAPAAAASRPAAAAVLAPVQSASAAHGGRTPQPPHRRSPVAVSAAAAAACHDSRPAATPTPRPIGWGSSPGPAAAPDRDRGDSSLDEHGGERQEREEEEEEEESLMSRRTAAAAANAASAVASVVGETEVAASGSPLGVMSAPVPHGAAAAADEAASDAAVLHSPGPSRLQPHFGSVSSPAETPLPRTLSPGGLLPSSRQSVDDPTLPATVAAASTASPASFGALTPITLSPAPSESPVGGLAAVMSELSSAATGGAGPRDDLLDGVGGGVSGGGAAGGEQHVTNPLYDIWSNSSSATITCKAPSVDAPGLAAAAVAGAAGSLDEVTAAPAGQTGGNTAASRWGVKTGSERSSMGSDGGIVPQHAGSQMSPSPPQQQQQERGGLPLRPPLVPSAHANAAGTFPVTPASPPSRPPGAIGAAGLATPIPRLELPPPGTCAAAADVSPFSEAAPAGSAAAAGASAETGSSTVTSATTVVTIQTLAAELLRHGSGAGPAAASGDGSSASSHVVMVCMVFQVAGSGASGGGLQQVQPAAAALKGPAWVENPDGSVQVLVPQGAANGTAPAAAVTALRLRHRRPVGATSDDIMDVPYTDYNLPELQPLPPLGLDPYIADGGNEPARIVTEAMDPAEEAEEADELLMQQCAKMDAELSRLVAAEDATMAGGVTARDHRFRAGASGGVGSGGGLQGGGGKKL